MLAVLHYSESGLCVGGVLLFTSGSSDVHSFAGSGTMQAELVRNVAFRKPAAWGHAHLGRTSWQLLCLRMSLGNWLNGSTMRWLKLAGMISAAIMKTTKTPQGIVCVCVCVLGSRYTARSQSNI